MLRADDPGDVLHQRPRARDIDARVQHHHQRHPIGRQVVGVDHVALGVAVVADPAVLVFERQPVERAVAFLRRRQELLLLLLHGGRDQFAHGQVARPHPHVVERRDQVARRPAPGGIPVRRIHDLAVRHLEVAVGIRRRDFASNREHRVGQALRLQDLLLDEGGERLAGDFLDDQAEQDRVGVAIVELGSRRELQGMAEGDLQQLLRRIFPHGLLRHVLVRVVGVVEEPAAHLRELPERDPVAAWHALDVAVDRIVETKLALVRQHQEGGGHERLGVAADAHVEVGGHRLVARRVADAEGPHIGRVVVVPDADNGTWNGGPLYPPVDRLVQCGVPLVSGALPK